jgi:hypothetical protein
MSEKGGIPIAELKARICALPDHVKSLHGETVGLGKTTIGMFQRGIYTESRRRQFRRKRQVVCMKTGSFCPISKMLTIPGRLSC